MDSIGINQNIYLNQKVSNPFGNSVIPPITPSERDYSTSFKGENKPVQQQPAVPKPPLNLRTELTTDEEKTKYSQILSVLDKSERKNLEILLKAGVLLNTNSNDKSSTLDNLYKIAHNQRAVGLDAINVLNETINTIANPFIITQNFGDVPEKYANQLVEKAQKNPEIPNDVINKQTIDVKNSSACVSASIEFNLAIKMPAEFARFAEQLTSPKVAVDKTISLKNLANNTLDAVWLLNAFKVPYEMHDFDRAKLTLAPDKNAIMRAQIQNSFKDPGERSLIDVLMQSTFMNVGSEGTYDSLTDNRGGQFNNDNKGLIEFEKTFTESIVEDKNKTSVTYQILDDKGKVSGYETDFNTVKRQILESLAMGENVIIGYTYLINKKDLPPGSVVAKDGEDEILSGHEITIIGAAKDKNGKLIFICNDTDDDNPNPIAYPEDYIVPKIHHAGLPTVIAEKDTKYVDSWVEGMKTYKQQKMGNSKQ